MRFPDWYMKKKRWGAKSQGGEGRTEPIKSEATEASLKVKHRAN